MTALFAQKEHMTHLFSRCLLIVTLAAGYATAACGSSSTVDTANGKTISDLDIGSDLTLDKGKTQQVTATVQYADGTTANVTAASDLIWNIGNTGVATISKTGMVTGVSVGATTIQATYQGKESTSHALVVK